MIDHNEIAGRWRRAQSLMRGAGLDAVLASEKSNYWYLTGHLSREFDKKMRPLACLLPASGEPTLIVYGQQRAAAARASGAERILTYEDVPFPVELLAEAIRGHGLEAGRIGMEFGEYERLGISYAQLEDLRRQLPRLDLVDGGAVFQGARAIKSAAEVEIIRRACLMSLEAWRAALARFRLGMTNRDLKRILASELAAAGSEFDIAGHITMGNGAHGIEPYREGETVWSDFGGTLDGYQADLARRAIFGEPSPERQGEHRRINAILDAGIEAIRPGVRACDVARVVSGELERAGHPPLGPKKRVGHGLGLCGAEIPSLSLADEIELRPGMVLTPEPRFNLPWGERVHVEEVVVVTERGCERLTHGAEELAVIG